jgi:hypothetical protein
MKLLDMSSEVERARTVLRIIAMVSLVVMLVVITYGVAETLSNPTSPIGSSFVDVEFPSPYVSPVYFKPITILYIAAGLLLYSSLELAKEQLRSLSTAKKTLIKAFCFIVAVTFVYEIGYNFSFWSGQIAAESIRGTLEPDLISNPFPNLQTPINVVFASRLFVLFTIAGLYAFYFMSKLDNGMKAKTE